MSSRERETQVEDESGENVRYWIRAIYSLYYMLSSYKRTGTLINTLDTYATTNYFQTRRVRETDLIQSFKNYARNTAQSLLIILPDAVAVNQRMRGTEYIGFDSLITSTTAAQTFRGIRNFSQNLK